MIESIMTEVSSSEVQSSFTLTNYPAFKHALVYEKNGSIVIHAKQLEIGKPYFVNLNKRYTVIKKEDLTIDIIESLKEGEK